LISERAEFNCVRVLFSFDDFEQFLQVQITNQMLKRIAPKKGRNKSVKFFKEAETKQLEVLGQSFVVLLLGSSW